MDITTIESKIIDVLAQKTGEPVDKITKEAHLKRDLGLDSLDLLELEYELEQKFMSRIDINTEFTPGTVGELIETITKFLV